MKHLASSLFVPCLVLIIRPRHACSLALPSFLRTIKDTALLHGPSNVRTQSSPVRPFHSRVDRVSRYFVSPFLITEGTLGSHVKAHVRRSCPGNAAMMARDHRGRRLLVMLNRHMSSVGSGWKEHYFRSIVGLPTKVAGVVVSLVLALCTKCTPAMASLVVDANAGRGIVSRQVQVSVESAFRIVFASILGSVLGLERSSTSRKGGQSTGAGMRTMALVSLGACVFCMCGTHGFAVHCATETIPGLEYASVDSSRMASNVATGVGFIGAGVITNNRSPDGTYDVESAVRGLTTAATIWMSAAVGAAAGAGMYFAAGQFVLLCLLVLRLGEWIYQTKDPMRRSDQGPKKMKSGPRDGTNEGISEVKNVPSPMQLSEVSAEPEPKSKSWSLDFENATIVEEGPRLATSKADQTVEFTNATQTGDGTNESKDKEAKSVVDPLVEKFLQRGDKLTVASKNEDLSEAGDTNSTDTKLNSTKQEGDSDGDSDLADSQQVIW